MKKSAYTSYDELPLVISVPEIAKILGIAVAGAYELVKQPDFPAFSVGSRILVPKEKFIAWLDEQTLENSAKNV